MFRLLQRIEAQRRHHSSTPAAGTSSCSRSFGNRCCQAGSRCTLYWSFDSLKPWSFSCIYYRCGEALDVACFGGLPGPGHVGFPVLHPCCLASLSCFPLGLYMGLYHKLQLVWLGVLLNSAKWWCQDRTQCQVPAGECGQRRPRDQLQGLRASLQIESQTGLDLEKGIGSRRCGYS